MIKKTTDYGQFKKILGNRYLNHTHIAQLTKEIERQDLLDKFPILVNEKKEIIDGQHRLEAAQKLGKPVYYIEVKGLDIKNVVRLNSSQRRWGIWDYINLHIQRKSPEYIKLKAFCERWNTPPSRALLIVSNTTFQGNDRAIKAFREGDFVMEQEELGDYFMGVVNKIKPSLSRPEVANNSAFLRALRSLNRKLEKMGENLDLFVDKLEMSGEKIHNYSTIYEYMREFEGIINYGVKHGRIRLF